MHTFSSARLMFIGSLLIGLHTVCPSTASATTRLDDTIQRFVVRSDTQYPRTEETHDDPEESIRLLTLQDNAINTWRRQFEGTVPVFLNGDVTEFGHSGEWSVMNRHLDNVTPTYYGLGNHDYDNNVDDCLLNLCAERSLKFLEASFSKWQVEDKDVIRRNDGVWQGSYGYSKTVGAITFIQLNNHYNYSRRFTSGTNTHYEITPSLDWLEKQLVKAQANGKFIVINLHRPPADSTYGSEADRERFYQLVNAFKVLAIFHGHTHEAARRASIGVTPVYDSGASFKQTFLVSELEEGANAFTTFLARNNTVGSTPLDKVDIRLLPPLPTFSFQNQPGGGAIVATLAYDNTPRSFHLPIIELSIDGGAFKRYTPSNNVILMYDLKPRTTYTYKTRLYLAAGGNPIRVDDGSFETPAIESPPTDLCVNFFNAIDGWFELKWKPPTPSFTMPYAIQVEANEPAHATWVVRSIGEFRQTTTQVVRYEEKGRNPFNMSYSVFYWSPTLGYSATATLKGEDLLKSGCQY